MPKLHINTSDDGDWIDVFINSKHYLGGHSLDFRDAIDLLERLGMEVTQTTLTAEAMEEFCRAPVWPDPDYNPELHNEKE